MKNYRVLPMLFLLLFAPAFAEEPAASPKYPGYQGIWFTLGQQGEFGDKYSGGLGTYTAKHKPIAFYSEKANKTFFVYGGSKEGKRHLLIMASYYDHATGQVPQPTVVLDKQGVDDPHDNASITMDDEGHVWVFVSGRGRGRPGFKFRSHAPYSVDSFEQKTEEEITYPQPWYVSGEGFIHLFTKYTKGRELYWNNSVDGETWTEDQKLAGMGGHYQNSGAAQGKVYSAFNMHPGGNVDLRTNLYFVWSKDFGKTWETVDGTPLEMPLVDPQCAALVRDYRAEKRMVYMKDIGLDTAGNPVILYITSSHHMPGPQGDPRTLTVAHWTDGAWQYHEISSTTHNYDMGSLYIEGDLWRVIAPVLPGPQRLGAGGEVAIFESTDAGAHWTQTRQVTQDSRYNHSYVRRPVNAHDDFYAFWADGDPDAMSESHLYFTNRTGETVWQLPYTMTEPMATPTVYAKPASP